MVQIHGFECSLRRNSVSFEILLQRHALKTSDPKTECQVYWHKKNFLPLKWTVTPVTRTSICRVHQQVALFQCQRRYRRRASEINGNKCFIVSALTISFGTSYKYLKQSQRYKKIFNEKWSAITQLTRQRSIVVGTMRSAQKDARACTVTGNASADPNSDGSFKIERIVHQ